MHVRTFGEHGSVGHRAIHVSGLVPIIDTALVEHPGRLRGIRRLSEPVVDPLRTQSACAGVMASKTAGYVHDTTVGAGTTAGFLCRGGVAAVNDVVVPSVRLELTLDGF